MAAFFVRGTAPPGPPDLVSVVRPNSIAIAPPSITIAFTELTMRNRTTRSWSRLLLYGCISTTCYGWLAPNQWRYQRNRVELSATPPNDASLQSALAVVPPDEAWDRLQRARHFCRDPTYTVWPPCLRLFHPFTRDTNTALDVAALLERYEIAPFTIRLTQWSIIPNAEAMEADWKAMRHAPEVPKPQSSKRLSDEERRVQDLIAREEELGREKLEMRRRKNLSTSDPSAIPISSKVSPDVSMKKQKKMYEEFNGPCVVCLEPDMESKAALIELRSLLLEELFPEYGAYSPTSCYSTDYMPRQSEFRPVIPIGSFPTVSAAIEVARKLRKLWKPLEFTVTDLQYMSREAVVVGSEEHEDNREYQLRKTSWLSHVQDDEKNLQDNQFGCDALIMFMGEEMEVDDEYTKEMVDLLTEKGEPGGCCSVHWDVELHDGDGSVDELEKLLQEDEDYDEGTVLVMGRTHFFTGEMREYVGMPATSVTDAKDRILGDAVSGAARRRGVVHRSGAMWEDGEWGRKDVDYLPWSRMERQQFVSDISDGDAWKDDDEL